MKIDIYTLLGMIKDGNSPKKIYFDKLIWKYEEFEGLNSDGTIFVSKDYKNIENGDGLFDLYVITDILNDEITILETTIKPDLGTIICYKEGEYNSPGYVGVVEKVNEDGSVCLKQNDKIEKIIPTSLKGINNLDEKIEIAHIDTISAMDKINEIIDKVNKD